MKQVHIALEDEGQCLEIWSGDHRQNSGGLRQTEEAKRFRRKLIRRPLALRCQTEYVQLHGLAVIAARYLDGDPDSPGHPFSVFARSE